MSALAILSQKPAVFFSISVNGLSNRFEEKNVGRISDCRQSRKLQITNVRLSTPLENSESSNEYIGQQK